MIDWELDDRYAKPEGRLFLTGTQALVKLPLLQHLLDQRAGLNTAGFISGYRGSPLGNYDSALWGASSQLAAANIFFQPGVNEDLAATAVLGSQQANSLPMDARYAGVFAIWYGKGPGVDRSIDALRHGNMHGASENGGVLVLAGDDHGGKSSTVAHQSDQALMAAGIPVISPAGLEHYLRLGLWGWAMSRATGVWAGFKCVTETVESSGTVEFRLADAVFTVPDGLIDSRFRKPLDTLAVLAEEDAFLRHRLPAVLPFARANPIDFIALNPPRKRLGIVAVGKAAGDVQQALADLGLDAARAEELGLGLFVVQLAWPLETQGLVAFAKDYDEILVVEEKRAFVEPQIKDALYHLTADARPIISGKQDAAGQRLFEDAGEYSPARVRHALLARMRARELADERLMARADQLAANEPPTGSSAQVAIRTPAFCSGCPHNTSTKIPEGSFALSGIGCHTMAAYMPDRPTGRPTQMGGEGTNWIGMAPFVQRQHIFQNIGDGTYFHSGLLAIRAAVAAGVNITYKILFNDAVAMTGGQPIDGQQSVGGIARQLLAEGVSPVLVVTDDVSRYTAGSLPAGVDVHDRSELIAIELRVREQPGASAIIYEQTCAAEKRRRRKKGTFPDPAKRYLINPDVCEGCGDCGVQSNCVSLVPDPTPFGVKRRIDQSSCNKDYSCVKGFCPSFITVLDGELRKAPRPPVTQEQTILPLPEMRSLKEPHNIIVAGIGGTGVVTVGAVMGMAAHLAGLSVSLLDLTGLSQKNGAVASHVRIANSQDQLGATRIGVGAADALIACDLLVAVADDVRKTLHPETGVVLNTNFVPVAAFQQARDMDHGMERALASLKLAADYRDDGYDTTQLAETDYGNAAFANMMLLGTAWQKGFVPIPLEAMERAITLNGVAVKANLAAFNAGRRSAIDGPPEAFVEQSEEPETLDQIVARYRTRLTAFQNASYADEYSSFVADIARSENEAIVGSNSFAKAVAGNLGKLMAYKDEYEVARLHHASAKQAVAGQFAGEYRLRYNLAPPLFSRRDPVTGHLQKREFGSWMGTAFRVLAAMKGLRGTMLDPFGYTEERRRERALITDYRSVTKSLASALDAKSHARAVEIAMLPDVIRGFGHVKEAAMDAYDIRLAQLLAEPLNEPVAEPVSA